MKRKQILCILCAAVRLRHKQTGQWQVRCHPYHILLFSPYSRLRHETGSYEVLEQDSQGRELVARSGDSYITTEYDDAAQKTIQYYSQGPLEGNNFTQRLDTAL